MTAPAPTLQPLEQRNVTLFVPGLLESGSGSRTLRRLLGRSDSAGENPDRTTCHFQLFGMNVNAGLDMPVAAVTRVADMGIVDQAWWIRADPVYLEPRRDSLILRGSVGLKPKEATALAAELNETLMLDGWTLKAPHPDRWYLKPADELPVVTTPLSDAIGRNVDSHLPKGPHHTIWISRLTEMQILLHTSAINADRESRGKLPANSVWFWGGGRLPAASASVWDQVIANDPVSVGLARLTGSPVRELPLNQDDPTAVLGYGNILIVPEMSNSPDSDEPLRYLTRTWLDPLLTAVHRSDIDRLTITTDRAPQFTYRKRHRWRVWRRDFTLLRSTASTA